MDIILRISHLVFSINKFICSFNPPSYINFLSEMSSNIDSNGLVASLSDKLDQNASLLLNTFDKLEDSVRAVGQERKIFLLERTRETLEKLHLIDEDSNSNNNFLKLNIEKVANNNKKQAGLSRATLENSSDFSSNFPQGAQQSYSTCFEVIFAPTVVFHWRSYSFMEL